MSSVSSTTSDKLKAYEDLVSRDYEFLVSTDKVKHTVKHRRGLPNYEGSTCFINSSLQFLSSIPEFLHIFNVKEEDIGDLDSIKGEISVDSVNFNVKELFINLRKILRYIYRIVDVIEQNDIESIFLFVTNQIFKETSSEYRQFPADEAISTLFERFDFVLKENATLESITERINMFYNVIKCKHTHVEKCQIDNTVTNEEEIITEKVLLIKPSYDPMTRTIQQYLAELNIMNETSANKKCKASDNKDLNDNMIKTYSRGDIVDTDNIIESNSSEIKKIIVANNSRVNEYVGKYILNCEGSYNKITGCKILSSTNINLYYEQTPYSRIKIEIKYIELNKYIIIAYPYKEGITNLIIDYLPTIDVNGTTYELCSYIYAAVEYSAATSSSSGHYIYKYKNGGHFETINDNIFYERDSYTDPRKRTVLLYKKVEPTVTGGGQLINYKNKYLKYKAKYLKKKNLLRKY
jgi:hypothetical protein